MHNIVLLKMCFLKNVHLENAYIYKLKKNTVINNAKSRNDLELYQIALRMLLSFMLLVYT